MKAQLRYFLTRLCFWRRCWWCAYSGFGNWPTSAEPEAVCHLLSKGGRVVTVAPDDTCSRWEGVKNE